MTDERDRPVPSEGRVSIGPLANVRGSDSGFPVSLCHDDETGRIIIRAINEGGFSCADVDFYDLLLWLNSAVPGSVDIAAIAAAIAAGDYRK